MRQNSLIHRHSFQHDRHQPGCIWGLLKIFDFRQRHSPQRLLSDRRRGNGANVVVDSRYSRKRVNISDRDESYKNSHSSLDDLTDQRMSDETVFSEGSSAQVPMKTLIANEISMDNYGHNLSPDSERRIRCKVQKKKKNRTSKMVHNFHSDGNEASKSKKTGVICSSRSMEQFPGATFQSMPVDRLYDQSDYQQSQLESKVKQDSCHDLKHITSSPTEDFIYQKFYDVGFLSEDDGFQHSKEFMDALEILNSNKELFLKLLQDPNSLLSKHIQGLKNAEMEQISKMKSNKSSGVSNKDNNDKGFSKQSPHRLSRIRQMLWGKGSLLRDGGAGASQNSTKIVVLKPGTAGIQDNVNATGSRPSLQSQCDLRNQGGDLPSSCTLKEIKKKIQLAISDAKAEQRRISMDSVLHKIPYGYQSSEEVGRNDDEEQLTGESSHVFKKTRHLRSQSWKERNWRPLRPQGVIVDEWSILSGLNYLENKKVAYSRSLSQPRESAATRDAKGHFSETLDAKSADECLFTRPTARTLGRVFSLPDHILSSPQLNPWRDDTYEEVQTQSQHLGFEFDSCFSREKVSDGRRSPNPDLELENSVVSDKDIRSCNQTNGETPQIQEIDSDCGPSKELPGVNLTEEVINTVGTESSKVSAIDERRMEASDAEEGTSKTKLSNLSAHEYEEEQFSHAPDVCTCSSPEQVDINMDTSIQNSAVDMTSDDYASPSTSFQPFYQAVQSNIYEKFHQPSPVSVLDSAISEDISSPDVGLAAAQAEILIQPRKIHFEEVEDSQRVENLVLSMSNRDENGTPPLTSLTEIASKTCPEAEEVDFEYVRTLLEASKLTGSKECCLNWDVSVQPLDPSIFFLVDPPGEVSVDQLLFFDCVNEVLLEISQRSSGCQDVAPCCKPRVRPFPTGENLIKEVWSGLKWHLSLHTQDTRTLEKLVERDLAKSSWWMDLTSDAQAFGVDIEVTLLEDLIEETVTELVC